MILKKIKRHGIYIHYLSLLAGVFKLINSNFNQMFLHKIIKKHNTETMYNSERKSNGQCHILYACALLSGNYDAITLRQCVTFNESHDACSRLTLERRMGLWLWQRNISLSYVTLLSVTVEHVVDFVI
jgi:hypothetical protein